MAELFRKNALDHMATPEQLDKQIKIIRPSTWIISVILVIGMITFVIWSISYHITDGVNLQGVIFTNQNVVQIKAQRSCMVKDVLVSEGEYVDIGDIIAVVSNEEQLDKVQEMQVQIDSMDKTDKNYEVMSEMVKKQVDSYVASTVIKSNTSGYIQSVNNDGNALEAGENIASIMPDSGYHEVIAYVPLQTAQKLKIGMQAQVSPAYAPREEYGYMSGVITEISEFPVTKENIQENMGTFSYVESILPDTSAVEVRIKLELDSQSENNYLWSNPKGERLSVELGTQCTVIAITDEYRPIELLLD